MRMSVTFLGGAALLSLGYVLGATQLLSPAHLFAQADTKEPAAAAAAAATAPSVDISDEAKSKIRAAADALKAAADALIDEGKYTPATKGVNTFAVLTGGGNAIRDLENGAVVDPETFAALYADLATDTIAADLGRDAEGRLTYKNKVVRIYPLSFLRGRYAIRSEITGEELLPVVADQAAKAKPKPADKPAEDATDEE